MGIHDIGIPGKIKGVSDIIGKMPYKVVTSDYTLDPENDHVIIVVTIGSNITITLPLASEVPNDGYLHEYYVSFVGGSNNIKVELAGGQKFNTNNTYIELNFKGETVQLGANYTNNPLTENGWAKIGEKEIILQARFSGTWDASNFTSFSAISFNNNDVETQSEILNHNTGTNPSRITVGKSGIFVFSYLVSLLQTGGAATWDSKARLIKNGTDVIDGSLIEILGNQKGTSQSVMPKIYIELAENDYIELEIYNSGLSGYLSNAVLNVTTFL